MQIDNEGFAVHGIVCPFCYKTFSPRDVRFKFSMNGAAVYLSAAPNSARTIDVLRRGNMQARVKRENGIPMAMGLMSKRSGAILYRSIGRVCAYENCSRLLSVNAGKYSPDNGIFLLGLKNSGKTVYISSTIEKLGNVLPKLGCSFRAYSPEVEESYKNNYYKTLFEEHRLPDATIEAAQLPYEVKNDRTGKVACVTFSDIKGEIARSPREVFSDEEISQTAAHSNFFLVTIDLKEMEQNPTYRQWNEDIFNFVLPVAAADMRRRANQYLAIVITKSDELRDFDSGNERARIFSSNSPIYDPIVHDKSSFYTQRRIINVSLRQYLEEKYPQMLLAAESVFGSDHVNYFAVSALGSPPTEGRCETISPMRVEEPIIWLLDRSGVMAQGREQQ